MNTRSRLAVFVTVAGLFVSMYAPAHAVDKCKVKVAKKDGVITVDAIGLGGPVLWGGASGEENNAFFNEDTCVSGTKAKKCVLADPASLAAATPPAACRIYLDDGVAACDAWVPGCIPGPRASTTDTNAATICDTGEVLDGDGNCVSISAISSDTAALAPLFCGDGAVQTALGEECDDGNTTSGDGCDSTCQYDCLGVEFAGGCWALAPQGVNCVQLCGGGGLEYDDLTRTYAGSSGTLGNCGNVLSALGFSPTTSFNTSCNDGRGCTYASGSNFGVRCTSPVTTAEAPSVADLRVCACVVP